MNHRLRSGLLAASTVVLLTNVFYVTQATATSRTSGQWPTPVVDCVANSLGRAIATELDNRSRQPTSTEGVVIAACFSSGGSSNSGSSSGSQPSATTSTTSPSKTAAQLACKKAGQTKTVTGVKLVCTKSGKNLLWAVSAGTSSNKTERCPSLDELIKRIVGPPEVQKYQAPTASEIACNAKTVSRKSSVKGLVQINDVEFEDRPDYSTWGRKQGEIRQVFRTREESLGFKSALSSNTQQNGLPPHDFEHPIPLSRLEEVARVYSAVLLKEKSKGHAVLFLVTEPPYGTAKFPMKPTSTIAEYKSWLNDYWVPRVKILATAAETIKAEYFEPFVPEADMAFNLSFSSLSGTERVALAQEFIDTTRRAASAFKGVLVGRQGWQFEASTDGARELFAKTPMSDLSWKGYGVLGVSLLPTMPQAPCTKEYARSYLQKQLAVVTQMAKRDGIPWAVHELDVFTFGSLAQYSGCANALAVYSEIWQAVIDELNTVVPAPQYVSVWAPSEWTSNSTVLKELARIFSTYKQR